MLPPTEDSPLNRMARKSCSRMNVPMKMVMTKKMATQGVMDCRVGVVRSKAEEGVDKLGWVVSVLWCRCV